MNIFNKRPLSLILCVMLGSFVFFAFCDITWANTITLIILLIALICTFITPIKIRIKYVFSRVIIVCAILSVIASSIYFDMWFKVYNRYSNEVNLVGTIIEMEDYTYQKGVVIKTENINEDYFSNYKLMAYIESDNYYGFSIGSKVSIKGKIDSLKAEDSNFDMEIYYAAQGISGIVTEISEFTILDVGDYPFEYKISRFRENICRKIVYTSNEDVGGLLCALLLGDRTMLPRGLQLDFSRIGISHILALSGMHLAILAIGLSKLLQFFKLRKKPATAITILFTVFYMAITGFSVSVTRAGLMLIISSLLYLLARTRDSLTSLCIAVFVICVLQPYAVYDLSLWLSAFATLGIVVMSEYQSEKYSKQSFFKWLKTSLLASVFSISATFAICITKFDGISLAAPITTIIFSLLVELFLYVGTALLFFGSFVPIKIIQNPIGKLIIYLAGLISDFKWIYTSTNFTVVEISSVIFTILFFSFFILKIKRKKLAITILSTLLFCIFAISSVLTCTNENKSNIAYYCSDNGEQMILKDSGNLCVVEISNYGKASAYESIGSIMDSKLTRIDKYVFTHYSNKLLDNIKTILNSTLIEEIYLPTPKNDTEERIFSDVANEIKKHRASLYIYRNNDSIEVGNHAVYPLYNSEIGEKKINILAVYSNEKLYSYLNLDSLDGETKSMALETIAISDTIIFGRHESGSADYKFTYKIESAEEVIFSSKRIVMTKETLNFYIERKAVFYPNKIILTH